jgi:hypothetical protein
VLRLGDWANASQGTAGNAVGDAATPRVSSDASFEPYDGSSSSAPVDAGSSTHEADVAISGVVLTNHPEFAFADNGKAALTIVSAFIDLQTGSSFSSLLIHGEVENRSQVTWCLPLFDSVAMGVQDVGCSSDGPPYDGALGTPEVCLAPRARAAFRCIQNHVPPTLLADARDLSYAISALKMNSEVPHPANPALLSKEIVMRSSGWVVSGNMRSSSTPIYNWRVAIYAKNERGLLVDDSDAFPSNLGTIAANQTVAFEDAPFAFYTGKPEGAVIYNNFLVGTGSGGAGLSDRVVGEQAERVQAIEQARASYDQGRRLLRAQ